VDSYRERVNKLTKPLEEEEKRVEMMAMFLCDSGIVALGPSGDGSRLSTGHGWHRVRTAEAEAYRGQARLAPIRNVFRRTSAEDVLAGIRLAREIVGHWPSWDEYVSCCDQLKAAGLPSTITAAMRIYGSYPKAREAAGGPASSHAEGRQHADNTQAARNQLARTRQQQKG